jgi:hypothetical protein
MLWLFISNLIFLKNFFRDRDVAEEEPVLNRICVLMILFSSVTAKDSSDTVS